MSRVIGTDEEVSAGVGDLLHAACQILRDHGAVAGKPARHAQPHRDRAQDDVRVHVRTEMRGPFTAGRDEAERATFGAVRDDSKCFHGHQDFLFIFAAAGFTYPICGAGPEPPGSEYASDTMPLGNTL
jgi:hypothetical protein